jgi:hypothetical protein
MAGNGSELAFNGLHDLAIAVRDVTDEAVCRGGTGIVLVAVATCGALDLNLSEAPRTSRRRPWLRRPTIVLDLGLEAFGRGIIQIEARDSG